jgi:ribose transport system substrate-binding protein
MKRMAALVSGKSNIVVVSIDGQNNVDDRLAGAVDALSNFPALKITKILDDKGDPRSAADQISDLLQKKEKIDGIICLEASGGSGAAEAVHRFNLDGKLPIVAFDDDPATLDWIDKGVIAATVTQKPYVITD